MWPGAATVARTLARTSSFSSKVTCHTTRASPISLARRTVMKGYAHRLTRRVATPSTSVGHAVGKANVYPSNSSPTQPLQNTGRIRTSRTDSITPLTKSRRKYTVRLFSGGLRLQFMDYLACDLRSFFVLSALRLDSPWPCCNRRQCRTHHQLRGWYR